MQPLQLALKYMEIFFSGKNLEELDQLLAEDFIFRGPFYRFDSAADFIKSLKSDPPESMQYKIIQSYENKTSACILYQFSKPGIQTPMAQSFETSNGKITQVLLIFDSEGFK